MFATPQPFYASKEEIELNKARLEQFTQPAPQVIDGEILDDSPQPVDNSVLVEKLGLLIKEFELQPPDLLEAVKMAFESLE